MKLELQNNLVTWVFNDGFVPSAKITNKGSYSIISDYLGTPVEAYDEQGHKVWSAELDIYGRVKEFTGEKEFIPFRYQGQYEDVEIGLYYNRFRYYDPEQGNYTQIDPIGLAGGNPTLYGYVSDLNAMIDPFGLIVRQPIIFLSTGGGVIHPKTISPNNPHGIFTIDATGSYFDDRAALAKEAGINDPGKNYRSHHIDYDPKTNTMRMQFVHEEYHKYPHVGGADDFKKDTGFKYGSPEAVAEATKRRNKLKGGCVT
ncbi:RHS repeat-associated core domain-containing protein [Lysinibacillus mangiferihumi]|uniref:RHS repeat-associated core domain-containing protein n=1 Tax=Lysinibacillus mangiferihumi TaxID=1130819 RepID=A0A4U2Z7J4_9BACI|nr:RHS repeat-associated core domain-containing protein [Lysinibacillus mangiferihumi]